MSAAVGRGSPPTAPRCRPPCPTGQPRLIQAEHDGGVSVADMQGTDRPSQAAAHQPHHRRSRRRRSRRRRRGRRDCQRPGAGPRSRRRTRRPGQAGSACATKERSVLVARNQRDGPQGSQARASLWLRAGTGIHRREIRQRSLVALSITGGGPRRPLKGGQFEAIRAV